MFFPNKVHQQLISEPLVTLGADGQFDVIARVSGGGVTGQAGALRLGIARALILVDPENRPALKRAGFLTRDSRIKERKKYGLKKARKAPAVLQALTPTGTPAFPASKARRPRGSVSWAGSLARMASGVSPGRI